MLVNAVRWLHSVPRVRITAPVNVQTVVTDDPQQRVLRVHFLGYNSPPQTTPSKNRPMVLPALIEDPPLYRAVLEFRDPVRSVKMVNTTSQLQHEGQRVEVLINDIHDVLLVQY